MPRKSKPEESSVAVADPEIESAVAVTVEVPNAPPETRSRWWIGTMPDSPIQNAAVGGQVFPRVTDKVDVDRNSGETMRSPLRGEIVMLTEKQIEHIKTQVVKKYVRGNGARASVVVDDSDPKDRLAKTDSRFRYNPATDTPLARCLYLMGAEGISDDMARARVPIPMAG